MSKNKFSLETKGYGLVANSVMENEELSLGAKGLYSYLISKTGAKEACFPSNKSIMKSLSISIMTLKKYKRELEDLELLVVEERTQKSGRMMSNLYYPTKFKQKSNDADLETKKYENAEKGDLSKKNKATSNNTDEQSELEQSFYRSRGKNQYKDIYDFTCDKFEDDNEDDNEEDNDDEYDDEREDGI